MSRTLASLAALTLFVVGACAGDPFLPASPGPSGSPTLAQASPSPTPLPTVDPEGELCQRVVQLDFRLAALQAVGLRLPNRTELDVELDKLLAAYAELERVELGDRQDELEGPLTRLGYRLRELELAVEDFRTNTRPRRAAPHVEEDSGKVADELAAFVILSRCRT